MATLSSREARDAEKARPAASARFYRPELDSLRFLAFLLVMICHSLYGVAAQSRVGAFLLHVGVGGSFGVDLFFVLSAYLITELLRREKLATGSIDIGGFYLRRILRLWPLYFGFLALYFVARRSTPSAFPAGAFAAFALFCGNWYLAGMAAVAPLRSAVVPLWSVSVEEQFYLVWPLVARFANKVGMAAVALGFVAASFATQYAMLRAGALHNAIWVNSLVHGGAIGIGILSALALDGRAPRIPRLARVAMMAASLLLFAAADGWFRFSEATAPVGDGMAAFGCGWLGVVLLFYAFLGSPQDGLKFTTGKGLEYLGRISYGLYVFHVAALDVVKTALLRLAGRSEPATRFALALVVTVLLAAASYRWYESPFLALKRRFARIPSGAL
jgi:peptidoglycan/LPS O-acetylase OafA/YrhL